MTPAQPSPTKAKSRLSLPKEPEKDFVATVPLSKASSVRIPRNVIQNSSFIRTRLKFIPILFLGLVAYVGCFFIVSQIDPENIANIVFFHSYLPLQLAFFLGNFFVLNFLFLHTRRAFFITCILSTLLFLRLQSVSLTPFVLFMPLVFFLTLETIFSFIFKK